jgi:hypothetical protein
VSADGKHRGWGRNVLGQVSNFGETVYITGDFAMAASQNGFIIHQKIIQKL